MNDDFASSDPNGALIRVASGLASTARRGRAIPKTIVVGVCLLTGFGVLLVVLTIVAHLR